jgi:hypothetical protein
MAKINNLGWKEPDPNEPWTIHLSPKPDDDEVDGDEKHDQTDDADASPSTRK